MKSILLLRHAESSKGKSGLKDFDRPLTDRGREDARRMGAFAKGGDIIPGRIISSPAKRAKQTVDIFANTADIDLSLVKWNKDFYSGGPRDYLSAVQSADKVDSVLLVGHNPLLEQAVSLLCNKKGAYTARMPTGALLCIEHPAMEWEQVKPGTARLKWMMIPELLEKMS